MQSGAKAEGLQTSLTGAFDIDYQGKRKRANKPDAFTGIVYCGARYLEFDLEIFAIFFPFLNLTAD